MTTPIAITRLTRRHRIDTARLKRLATWLLEKTRAMDPERTWLTCSVVIVDHARMEALNREALRHSGTTDVITLTYASVPGEPTGWHGEVVINADRARDVGAHRRGGPSRELALYLAHGFQHLGGADDRTTRQRQAMNRRQNRWLREANTLGLVQDLLQ